ncbi:MAG: DUF1501 domain-containing protein [Dehalococcoidales bacterium]|jgi:uncharacterized protein (DUF1501 family)|nr:DUF1501 domain-containing protein [Dehalococcoidales bacterium]
MVVSRRQFLKSSAILMPSVVLLPGLFRRGTFYPPQASAASAASPILVVVQQAGGNDGLNTIIPYNDGLYYDLRPNVAIPQQEVITIDNEVGFHPNLPKFKALWDSGNLAIVEGVGYPTPNLSHFQSMDIWRFADPEGEVKQGWLGRYLETLGGGPDTTFSGISVGGMRGRFPPELYSPQVPVPLIESVNLYQFQSDPRYAASAPVRKEALAKMYSLQKDASYLKLLNNTFDAASASSADIVQADKSYNPAVVYPDTSLGKRLRILAAAIVADLGVKVGHVAIGGWDTHASQKPDHVTLLRTLSEAVSAFYEDLKGHGKDGNVVIMTWSEFGRRAKSNASDGTDHGTAVPMFFIGTPVKGGFYGERPDLGSLSSDNLRFTVDFRSVYATVLEEWFGTPSNTILGQQYETLPIFNTAAAAGRLPGRDPVSGFI